VLLAERSSSLRARSDVDVENALVVALEVGDRQDVVKVQHVAERLQEDVCGADESILDGLPERIFILGDERDILVTVEPRLIHVLHTQTCHFVTTTLNKKLSCRREAARCFVSLNTSLSHSRSLKVIRNDTLEYVVCKSFPCNYVSISYRF